MIIRQEHPKHNPRVFTRPLPAHVEQKWRYFTETIDQALEAGLKPWPLAESACAAISAEWLSEVSR